MKNTEFINLVKKGRLTVVSSGQDLLGKEVKYSKREELSFEELKKAAKAMGVSDSDFVAILKSVGSVKLLYEALASSKDFETWARAYFEKDSSNIENKRDILLRMGCPEEMVEELMHDAGFKKKNTLKVQKTVDPKNIFSTPKEIAEYFLTEAGLKQSEQILKRGGISLRDDESIIKAALKRFDINLDEFLLGDGVIEKITSKQVMVDILKSVEKDENLEISKRVMSVFDDPSIIEKLVYNEVISRDRPLFKKKNFRDLKENDKVLMTNFVEMMENIVKGHANIIKKLNFLLSLQTECSLTKEAVGIDSGKKYTRAININDQNSKYGAFAKSNFAKSKFITDAYREFASALADEYLKYIGKSVINTKTRSLYYFALFAEKRLDYKKATNEFLKEFHKELRKIAENEGLLQEYSKARYVLLRFEYIRNSKPRIMGEKERIIKEKYEASEAYKKLPVPFAYLYFNEISDDDFTTKYPSFILAANFIKKYGFNAAILGCESFYEEGFDGLAFERENRLYRVTHGLADNPRDVEALEGIALMDEDFESGDFEFDSDYLEAPPFEDDEEDVLEDEFDGRVFTDEEFGKGDFDLSGVTLLDETRSMKYNLVEDISKLEDYYLPGGYKAYRRRMDSLNSAARNGVDDMKSETRTRNSATEGEYSNLEDGNFQYVVDSEGEVVSEYNAPEFSDEDAPSEIDAKTYNEQYFPMLEKMLLNLGYAQDQAHSIAKSIPMEDGVKMVESYYTEKLSTATAPTEDKQAAAQTFSSFGATAPESDLSSLSSYLDDEYGK